MKNFKSGKNINQGRYKSFQPTKINKKWRVENEKILELLTEANRELGRLDVYSNHIPSVNLFISMHVLKEASQSTKIEGTKTNIEEALLNKKDINEEKRDDWDEVQNYIVALNSAIKRLKEIPFSSQLIKETHKILLRGVRGKHKFPGEFRTSQNWIGGARIDDAFFIPPSAATIDEYMSDLEQFAHNEKDHLSDLLKIALIHYQFETIHPFLDGNGRIGRLMITLYLVEKGILKKPTLYLSDFFERNRTLYYENLTRVREKHDIIQWCKFFLVGIIETAQNSSDSFYRILLLQKEVDRKLATLKVRNNSAEMLIHRLYEHPVIDAQTAKKITGLSLPSVYKLLATFENIGILEEMTGAKRGRIYIFRDYVDLFV